MARIAVFLPNLAGGGAERVCLWIAEGLAKKGHDVDLVVGQAAGEYRDQVPESVRLVDLRKPRVLHAILPLARYLRRSRPVALLSTMSHVNVVAVLARRLARVPTRIVLREAVHASSDHQPRRGMGILIPAAMRRYYPQADAVVAVSDSVASDLKAGFGIDDEALHVIPNPVDHGKLLALAEASSGARPAWRRDYIISLGRLEPQKDFETLIEAFRLLEKPRAGVDLVILGEGRRRASLEQAARRASGPDGKVWLPGFLVNPFPALAGARMLALTSRWEGLPNVVLQAIALGVPVVATDAPGGTREILDRTGGGILVPVGDKAAVARALQDVLSGAWHPPEDACERLLEYGDPGRVLKAYEDVLLTATHRPF